MKIVKIKTISISDVKEIAKEEVRSRTSYLENKIDIMRKEIQELKAENEAVKFNFKNKK